jgi:two-component system phosphate regulon sensor histidine kinase PhoR
MKGTGLGLAIVRHILVRHQGRLEIKSRPGEGARFTVELPFPQEALTET